MRLMTHIHEGFLNLFSSKLRSFLALLGILVGTASVVAMVLGGKLATNEALKQFQTLGTDLLAVTISDQAEPDSRKGSMANLTLQEVNNLNTADAAILQVAPYTTIYAPAQYRGIDLDGNILGVTDRFAAIAHVDVKQGRFISYLDGYTFYCVIGHGLYERIKHKMPAGPIGEQIQMGKNIFTIVGVAEPWPENSFVYANVDNSILVPLQASFLLSKYATINNIIIKLAENADIDTAKNHTEQYINHYVPGKKLFFRSAKELVTSMSKQSEILTVFLGLIGGISLLVGGIGVMNIMLVSVVERRREIGIRLAVGATEKDIRTLFLIEAVMLALIGGTIGVIIGVTISYFIALFWHWEFTLFLLPPLIGFTISAATGIFFGFYPAYTAAKLNPIEALRSE